MVFSVLIMVLTIYRGSILKSLYTKLSKICASKTTIALYRTNDGNGKILE